MHTLDDKNFLNEWISKRQRCKTYYLQFFLVEAYLFFSCFSPGIYHLSSDMSFNNIRFCPQISNSKEQIERSISHCNHSIFWKCNSMCSPLKIKICGMKYKSLVKMINFSLVIFEYHYFPYLWSWKLCKHNSSHTGGAQNTNNALYTHDNNSMWTFFTCCSSSITI